MDFFHIPCIIHKSSLSSASVNALLHETVTDLRYSGQRPVRRHDGQGEAAALVSEDDRWLPGHPLWQLHHQLEGWQTLQCCHTQALVSVHSFLMENNPNATGNKYANITQNELKSPLQVPVLTLLQACTANKTRLNIFKTDIIALSLEWSAFL